MIVGIQASQVGSSARAAQRCGDEGVLKMGSFPGKAVHVRSFNEGMPHEPHGVKPMVIAQYQQDIGLIVGV